MHELSVVQSIVDIAEDAVKKNNAHFVEAIDLEIGTQAGIEFDALDFAWDVAVKNTVLENSERRISKIQARARCLCGCEYDVLESFQPCPQCQEFLVNYIKGKELRVKSITVS